MSRSATTITGGLFPRLRGDVAAKFSFLLSIPTILGAVATEAKALFHLSPAIRGPLVIGIVVSGLSGLVAIAALLRLVQERRLVWFAYYCRGLGTFILAGCLIFGTT